MIQFEAMRCCYLKPESCFLLRCIVFCESLVSERLGWLAIIPNHRVDNERDLSSIDLTESFRLVNTQKATFWM